MAGTLVPNLFPSKSFANLESFLHSLSHSSHFTSPNLRASRPGSSCLAQSATMQSYSHRASLSQSRVFLRYFLMNTSCDKGGLCLLCREEVPFSSIFVFLVLPIIRTEQPQWPERMCNLLEHIQAHTGCSTCHFFTANFQGFQPLIASSSSCLQEPVAGVLGRTWRLCANSTIYIHIYII